MAQHNNRSDKRERILDAVATVLGRGGLAAVSMREVATEAGVALGLMNYYFDDKISLVAAALERVGESDALLVEPVNGMDAEEQLVDALRRVVQPEYLRIDYLGLRLQLWSLAPIDERFADINRAAQLAYRTGLAELIAAARPEIDDAEVERRAADILVLQNGIWLTSILIVDDAAIERSIDRCQRIALG